MALQQFLIILTIHLMVFGIEGLILVFVTKGVSKLAYLFCIQKQFILLSCKLFSQSRRSFSTTGYSNWPHASQDLSNHEKSRDHYNSLKLYLTSR